MQSPVATNTSRREDHLHPKVGKGSFPLLLMLCSLTSKVSNALLCCISMAISIAIKTQKKNGRKYVEKCWDWHFFTWHAVFLNCQFHFIFLNILGLDDRCFGCKIEEEWFKCAFLQQKTCFEGVNAMHYKNQQKVDTSFCYILHVLFGDFGIGSVTDNIVLLKVSLTFTTFFERQIKKKLDKIYHVVDCKGLQVSKSSDKKMSNFKSCLL